MAPSFIDIKTYSDFTLPVNPQSEANVRYTVITEIADVVQRRIRHPVLRIGLSEFRW